MIYWRRESGEKVLVKDMPTAELLEMRKYVAELMQKPHNAIMYRGMQKALTKFNRQLRKRNLL